MPELGGRSGLDAKGILSIRVWADPGFRNHLIFYRPLTDGIEVVRILHGARDWVTMIE